MGVEGDGDGGGVSQVVPGVILLTVRPFCSCFGRIRFTSSPSRSVAPNQVDNGRLIIRCPFESFQRGSVCVIWPV